MKRLMERIRGLKLNTKFTAVIMLFTFLPMAILSVILFYTVEQDTIAENKSYMSYKLSQNREQMLTNIDSLNMSTRFFLQDEALLKVLNRAYDGRSLTTEELIDFDDVTIANLERLVNNNPLLYAVRVYSVSDDVQEVMPISWTTGI